MNKKRKLIRIKLRGGRATIPHKSIKDYDRKKAKTIDEIDPT